MASPTTDTEQIPRNIGYFSSAVHLYTVDFPIFFIESISERHVAIAGGGGSTKTGVRNQINILELIPTGTSCAAKSVMKYTTPDDMPDAIMTGALVKDMPIVETRLITGGSQPTIYNFGFNLNNKTFYVRDYTPLKDSKARAEIKSVKYIPGYILSGGVDGQLTCWTIRNNVTNKIDKEIKAHSKEIDEIDVDTENEHVATLSRSEGLLIIWNLRTFEQIKEISSKLFKRPTPTGTANDQGSINYILRSCRFAQDHTSQAKNSESCLLIACNPTPAKNHPSRIYKWQSTKDDEYKLLSNAIPSCVDSIMAMTVSLDGKHVAVGTRSGGVCVMEVKKLHNIYRIEGAHHNAITCLEFLPPKPESLTLTDSHSCPLLSVSIDRRVLLHRPKTKSLSIRLVKTLFVVLVIYLILFILYAYYDLTSYIRLD